MVIKVALASEVPFVGPVLAMRKLSNVVDRPIQTPLARPIDRPMLVVVKVVMVWVT